MTNAVAGTAMSLVEGIEVRTSGGASVSQITPLTEKLIISLHERLNESIYSLNMETAFGVRRQAFDMTRNRNRTRMGRLLKGNATSDPGLALRNQNDDGLPVRDIYA
jgi:hypothetical protein